MPSPRLFGRDSSKKQGDEPETSEIEDSPGGRRRQPKANSAVMLNILGDLWGREKPVAPKSGG